MSVIWNFIMAIFKAIFDIQLKPVKIGGRVFMPLFYRDLGGTIDSTWNYLSKSDPEKLHLRNHIKDNAKTGETPAICFCLTPQNINGGLVDNKMLAVTDGMLDYLEAKCEELVEDGIAVFPCLYVDDMAPRWFEIEKHMAIWSRIHGRIAKYVTGYILSIETNEKAANMGHIEGCINIMRAAMPGAAWYGTHLQWMANNRWYMWNGITSLPKNADIILVEFSWNPHKGDAVGLQSVKNEYYDIQRANPTLKWVAHEYNASAGSATYEAQRAWLRSAGAWGVG